MPAAVHAPRAAIRLPSKSSPCPAALRVISDRIYVCRCHLLARYPRLPLLSPIPAPPAHSALCSSTPLKLLPSLPPARSRDPSTTTTPTHPTYIVCLSVCVCAALALAAKPRHYARPARRSLALAGRHWSRANLSVLHRRDLRQAVFFTPGSLLACSSCTPRRQHPPAKDDSDGVRQPATLHAAIALTSPPAQE